MIKTRREALAQHCGLDAAELSDYRYHYGHTSQAVWTIGDDYYTITKGSQKPAVHRSGQKWKWVEVPDSYVNQSGWKIWKHTNESE